MRWIDHVHQSWIPAVALVWICVVLAHAQTPDPASPATKPPLQKTRAKTGPPALNPNYIVLDPGHGGADYGARLSGAAMEKDATIALADRLRSLLQQRGFTVALTHESAADNVTQDQRVEVANRAHPAACLLLHVATGGHGVHLLMSSLTLPGYVQEATAIMPWDTAQAAMLTQSARLSSDLATSLNSARIPLVVGQTSVQPIDSMSCPALTVELAPLINGNNAATPATDASYQQRVAEALVAGLTFWRGHTETQASAAATRDKVDAASVKAVTPAPLKPKAKVKLITPPVEYPADEGSRKTPAPIVREPSRPAATPEVPR